RLFPYTTLFRSRRGWGRLRALAGWTRFQVDGENIQRLKFLDDRLHCAIGIAEKFGAADARENPAHALENGLAVHVFMKTFERMIAVAVALDGETLAVSFDYEIDAE